MFSYSIALNFHRHSFCIVITVWRITMRMDPRIWVFFNFTIKPRFAICNEINQTIFHVYIYSFLLDFLGRFLSMFSMYTTLFEFPSFLNSRLSLTKRLVSKPVKIPKKYYNESANIIYDVRPIEHIGGSGPGVSGGGEGGNVAIRPVAEIIDTFKDKLKAIYPGTLWCGDGNQARSEYEVGIFRNTDICCRMHDKCPSSIPAGHTYKNLRNGGLFTRSHCDCDQEFYRCLKKANSIVSNKIGYTYFNILRPQCYRREHPIIGCRKWYVLCFIDTLLCYSTFMMCLSWWWRLCGKVLFTKPIKVIFIACNYYCIQKMVKVLDRWLKFNKLNLICFSESITNLGQFDSTEK